MLFSDSHGYSRHSGVQRKQSALLIERIRIGPGKRVLDVGCGDGRVTLDLLNRFPGITVHGIDISADMIQLARELAVRAAVGAPTFEVANVLEYRPGPTFDVIFSNSSMHWVLPPEIGYRRLADALVPGGLLAVHQGGAGNYRGLWACAVEVARRLGLDDYFIGWSYPASYPAAAELRELLIEIGFADVRVDSHESDGRDHPSLIHDFAHAGLLPFLRQVPPDKRELFRAEFLRRAELSEPSLYEHRLFATAVKT